MRRLHMSYPLRFPIQIDARNGLIDENGRIIALPVYSWLHPYSDGMAGFKADCEERYGYIDADGNIVIPPRFLEIAPFKDGLARVLDPTTKHYGFIRKDGTYAVQPHFEELREMHEGLAAFGCDDDGIRKWGFVSDSSEITVPAKYYSVSDFESGIARVTVWTGENLLDGLINREGNIIVVPMYDRIYSFKGPLAAGYHLDGNTWRHFYLDRSGRKVWENVSEVDPEHAADPGVITGTVTNTTTGTSNDVSHFLVWTGSRASTIIYVTMANIYLHSDGSHQISAHCKGLDTIGSVFPLSINVQTDDPEEWARAEELLREGEVLRVEGDFTYVDGIMLQSPAMERVGVHEVAIYLKVFERNRAGIWTPPEKKSLIG